MPIDARNETVRIRSPLVALRLLALAAAASTACRRTVSRVDTCTVAAVICLLIPHSSCLKITTPLD